MVWVWMVVLACRWNLGLGVAAGLLVEIGGASCLFSIWVLLDCWTFV